MALSVATVDEMIDALDARWPGMRDRICDSTPAIRLHMNVFVNDVQRRIAVGLSEGMSPRNAVRLGSVAAGASTTRAGTAPSMLQRTEVDALLKGRM